MGNHQIEGAFCPSYHYYYYYCFLSKISNYWTHSLRISSGIAKVFILIVTFVVIVDIFVIVVDFMGIFVITDVVNFKSEVAIVYFIKCFYFCHPTL